MSIDVETDQILANARRPSDPHQDAAALAYCHRRLDGGALADVVAALGLGGGA